MSDVSETKEEQKELVYEYDPAKDSKSDEKKDKAPAKKGGKAAEPKGALGIETFGGKIFTPSSGEQEQKEYIRYVSSARTELGGSAKKHFESPLERMQRLKFEVESLKRDLELLSKGDPIKDISKSVAKNVDDIEMDFGKLVNDQRIAPFLPNDSALSKAPLAQTSQEIAGSIIHQLKNHANRGKSSRTYNLYQIFDAKDDRIRLLELDRRLSSLERGVGKIEKKTPFRTLNDAVDSLYKKLELFDKHKLDAIERRVKALAYGLETYEMPATAKKGTKKEEKAKNDKFEKLYATMKKWDRGIRKDLPQIVTRLQAQKCVHEANAEGIIRLQKIARQQLALQTLITQDRDALSDMTKGLKSNMAIMDGNLKSFKDRFAALRKNMGKLGIK